MADELQAPAYNINNNDPVANLGDIGPLET